MSITFPLGQVLWGARDFKQLMPFMFFLLTDQEDIRLIQHTLYELKEPKEKSYLVCGCILQYYSKHVL